MPPKGLKHFDSIVQKSKKPCVEFDNLKQAELKVKWMDSRLRAKT